MELHKPITFEQDSFRERALREDPDPAVKHAVVPLHEERAFFFTGAGSSAGAPTRLPTGPQLAAKLVEWAPEIGAVPRSKRSTIRTTWGRSARRSRRR